MRRDPDLRTKPDAYPAVQLKSPRHRLADAFDLIDQVLEWKFVRIEAPQPHTATRLKAVLLAVGALHEGGPKQVTVTPSVRGGLVATLVLAPRVRAAVACMNNRATLLVRADGIEEVSEAAAIARIRALGRTIKRERAQPRTNNGPVLL